MFVLQLMANLLEQHLCCILKVLRGVADVKKCPGWGPTSCGSIHKDQPGDYWMHRCNPLAVPKNDTATILSCKPEAVNGTFQCYFGQVIAAMTMHVVCPPGEFAYQACLQAICG